MDAPPASRYEAICEASPDAILLVDADGHITYADARVADLFGYAPSELAGEPVELLVPEAAREDHVAREAYLDEPPADGRAPRPRRRAPDRPPPGRRGSAIPGSLRPARRRRPGSLHAVSRRLRHPRRDGGDGGARFEITGVEFVD